jgi:hypothetical protein
LLAVFVSDMLTLMQDVSVHDSDTPDAARIPSVPARGVSFADTSISLAVRPRLIRGDRGPLPVRLFVFRFPV